MAIRNLKRVTGAPGVWKARPTVARNAVGDTKP
jgi:hypothetical protein